MKSKVNKSVTSFDRSIMRMYKSFLYEGKSLSFFIAVPFA